MSPFSKVEMSPFVVVKKHLQHEGTEQVDPLLPMSQRELTRLEVIQRVKRKTLKQAQAAELLSLSVRQINGSAKLTNAPELRVEHSPTRARPLMPLLD
jgi:hypothetical protein